MRAAVMILAKLWSGPENGVKSLWSIEKSDDTNHARTP
jgi:hypothetical protein